MSNYTQTTFFTPKDSLPITDPNKTIFGAAYDVEFANLVAAIATKLDSTFTSPSLGNLNFTSSGIPVNGFYLPTSNTLGMATNSAQIATFSGNGSVFGGATGGAQGAGTINAAGLFINGVACITTTGGSTFATVTVTGSSAPANGIYLPSANTFGIAANTISIATFATGGTVYGGATGGAQGAGTINATGLFINGVSVGTGAGATVGSGTATLSAASISVGQTYIVWRSASNTITSNATLTTDAVLQLTGVPIGNYAVVVAGEFTSASSSSANGYQATLNITAGSGTGYATGTSWITNSGSNTLTTSLTSAGTLGNQICQASPGSANTWTGLFSMQGQVAVTGAATIAFQWAQNGSSAVGTILQPGVYVSITRLK